jgi:hypothetical protein
MFHTGKLDWLTEESYYKYQVYLVEG